MKDRAAFPDWNPIYAEPAFGTVWLTENEWKSLVPEEPRVGDAVPIPDGVRKRLVRYHLVNRTFGLPGRWSLNDIRKENLTLKVEQAVPALRLRLEGDVLLATDADLDKAQRGYDARLLGHVEFDSSRKCTRFDAIAVGQYWGGDYEGGRFKRPGRTPLGIAFELATGASAVDLAPPLVHMDRKQEYDRYFAAERP